MKFKAVIAGIALSFVCAISASILAFGKPSPSVNLVAFEGVGSGTFNSQQTQFIFSVRCYGVNCAGAIEFGSPSTAAAVNYVTGTVTEVQQDTYMMSLSTPQAPGGTLPPNGTMPPSPAGTLPPGTMPPTILPVISCSLVNSPPITQGQTNTVTMNCSSPAGTGVSQNAVVVSPSAN